MPILDLHSHSNASDGALTPTALVERAVSRGVAVLALTDHDTTAGLAEAHQAAASHAGFSLIDGIELSTGWHGFEIHIVGLRIDPCHPSLQAFMGAQQQRRQVRAEAIAAKLERCGIKGVLPQIACSTPCDSLTRTHFARVLVDQGHVKDMNQAFKKYLAKGERAYVAPGWPPIGEAVEVIRNAGGNAVLAHPSRYKLSSKWLKRLFNDFHQAGGEALEVALPQQRPCERQQLAAWAREFGLKASLGSDFHQPSPWLDLGKNLWLPKGCEPIWNDWPEEASSPELSDNRR